jgi:DNA-binding NtrC family response regulator
MTQPRTHRVLIVDDDLAFRVGTSALLEDNGYAVLAAPSGAEAVETLKREDVDIVLSDLVMPGMNGIELLRRITERNTGVPVIMVTGFASIATAVEAMKLGARDYVTKPCDNEELLIKVARAIEGNVKDSELRELRAQVDRSYTFGTMVSNSATMKEVFRQIAQVAATDETVLLLGESGTGKELVARALHHSSKRSAGPFVAVNCSAIPETLMESELFGHEKGAFTGAATQRRGRFEEAAGGTLFLDEIGDTPLHVQTKLLRVLQERTIERVGGGGSIAVEARIIAATNRNLDVMMVEGDFREDLFYRLNVFPIHLPPLRDRIEDIPLLAEHFLQRHSQLSAGRVKHIADAAMQSMMRYSWRGNIRELENLMKRAIIKSARDTIESIELPGSGPADGDDMTAAPDIAVSAPFKEVLAGTIRRVEETYLRRMLELHKGNINHIAKLMDLDRKTIYRKMAEYKIDPAEFRRGTSD